MAAPNDKSDDPQVELENPANTIDPEKAEAYPHLAAFYEYIRKINHANKTKKDVEVENERMYQEFIYACKHDLLFFLTVTNQFGVIRALYDSPKLFGRLSELMERERGHGANQQETSFLLSKPQAPVPLVSMAHHPSFHWNEAPADATPLERLHHYEQEMQRITFDHQTKQINRMQTAHDSRIRRIDHAMNIIEANNNISPELKQKGRELHRDLIAKKSEMEAARNQVILDANGRPDPEAMQQLRDATEQKYRESAQKTQEFLQEVRYYDPRLEILCRENITESRMLDQTMKADDQQFKREATVLQSRIDGARVDAKKDVGDTLEAITEAINNSKTTQLNSADLNELDAAMLRLGTYQNDLKTADTYEKTQTILNKCKHEIDTIERIAKPVMREESREQFDRDIKKFNQMIVDPKIVQGLNESAVASSDAPVLNHGETVANDETIVSGVDNSASQTQNVSSEPIETPIVDARGQQPEEATTTPNQTRDYRFFMAAIRGPEIVAVNEELQSQYKETLSGFTDCLKELEEDMADDPGMLTRIEEIKSIIQRAESQGSNTACPADLKELCEKVGEFNHPSLINSKNNLSEIFNLEVTPVQNDDSASHNTMQMNS